MREDYLFFNFVEEKKEKKKQYNENSQSLVWKVVWVVRNDVRFNRITQALRSLSLVAYAWPTVFHEKFSFAWVRARVHVMYWKVD